MFNKSKKPENKDMVVAPVPMPPKDSDPTSPEKNPLVWPRMIRFYKSSPISFVK